MAKYKLFYFDFSGSRGEECRLALHLAGVQFEDRRLKDWPAEKAQAPFGALPFLEVEGLGTLAQSNAILCYVGRQYGLHPTDPWQAARHEALMCAVEDFRVKFGPLGRLKDPDEKKRQREEFATGYLQEWCANVEKQLGDGPFLAGEKIHVADLKLFVALSPFFKGTMDHVPAEHFKKFPKISRHYEAVRTHPKVVEWGARTQ